jgi:hypothetical protein
MNKDYNPESMAPNIILFNGPPRSGKDTCCDMLADYHRFQKISLAAPLKVLTHTLFNLKYPLDWYERHKEDKLPEAEGRSFRELLIFTSEGIIKPVLGTSWWAKIAIKTIKDKSQDGYTKFCISDLGFAEEYTSFIEAFHPACITIVQTHRDLCDFSKDSRSYINTHDRIISLYNNASLVDLTEKLEALIKESVKPC